MQYLVVFPEGTLSSPLPCVCIPGFASASLYLYSMTDACPESEKGSLDCGSFLFVAEHHGSGTDHYSSDC